MQTQLADPNVFASIFGTITLPLTTPVSVDDIVNDTIALYEKGLKFGLGADKVKFNGITLLPNTNPDPNNNVYSGIIRFIKIGHPSQDKPFGAPIKIRVSQAALGDTEYCYAIILDGMDTEFDTICSEFGDSVTDGICTGTQTLWSEESVKETCSEVNPTNTSTPTNTPTPTHTVSYTYSFGSSRAMCCTVNNNDIPYPCNTSRLRPAN
jgi:hypothetical protein